MKYFRDNGCFTSEGAKKFGFKRGNQLGKNTAGEKHGNWKGGVRYRGPEGKKYRWIRVGVRKYVIEQRYVMEKHLGRKLRDDEVVHHKDKDTLNNDITNLVVVKKNKHKALHKGSYKYPDFTCKCGSKKHFAKKMCHRCYNREYARKRYGYKRRFV